MNAQVFKKRIAISKNYLYNNNIEKNAEIWEKIEYNAMKLMKEAPHGNNDGIDLLARVKYERGNYLEAKQLFSSLLEKDLAKKRIYLNALLKCNIMLSDFEEAQKVLEDLLECLNELQLSADFGLIYLLLDILNNCYAEVEISFYKYMFTEINDDVLLDVYEELINSIGSQNYEEAIINAYRCDKISIEKNLRIDFLILFKLLVCVKRKSINEKRFVTCKELDMLVKQNDLSKLYVRILEMLEEDPKSVDIRKYSDILFKNGYRDEAKMLIQQKSNSNISKEERSILMLINKKQ